MMKHKLKQFWDERYFHIAFAICIVWSLLIYALFIAARYSVSGVVRLGRACSSRLDVNAQHNGNSAD